MLNLVWNPVNIYDENSEEAVQESKNSSEESSMPWPWNAKNIYE